MIFFLFGEDSFRSKQKLNELKNKFLKEVDPSGNSLTVVDGESASMEKINGAVASGSLLAKKRMIVIEKFFSNKNSLIFSQALLYFKEKKIEENIVVFWDDAVKIKKTKNKSESMKIDSAGKEKKLSGDALKFFDFLAKQKFIQQFNRLSNTDAAIWARKEIEKQGGKISGQAVQMLISLIGCDLWQVNNEINKLINYKSAQGLDSQSIEIADIELMVKGGLDENIFALTDAISNKNKAAAVKIFEEQVEAGLADSYLIAMIIRQVKILAQIRQALDLGVNARAMISLLKLHPFIIQKGIGQASRFTLPILKRMLGKLIDIDYQMKTGQADAKTGLNLLIANL